MREALRICEVSKLLLRPQPHVAMICDNAGLVARVAGLLDSHLHKDLLLYCVPMFQIACCISRRSLAPTFCQRSFLCHKACIQNLTRVLLSRVPLSRRLLCWARVCFETNAGLQAFNLRPYTTKIQALTYHSELLAGDFNTYDTRGHCITNLYQKRWPNSRLRVRQVVLTILWSTFAGGSKADSPCSASGQA